MEKSNRPKWSNQAKLIAALLVLVGVGYIFFKFSVAIIPFILAVILAYVLAPIVNMLQLKLKITRGLAILIVYLFLLLIVGGFSWIVVPILVSQIARFVALMQDLGEQAIDLLGEPIVIGEFTIESEQIINRILNNIQTVFEPVLGTTFDVVTGVVSSLIWVVFILVISIYLIKDSEAIIAWFRHLVPPAFQKDFEILKEEINTIWGAFFRGQLLLAFVVSIILTVESLIIGLRFPLLMGILGGFMEFMPGLGPGIWLVLASILAIAFGSTWLPIPNWAFLILVASLHIIFSQFDLNYLIPRIIGRSVRLPPMVVILGIVAGAAIAGVLGIVLAAPTIATLRILGRYIYANLFDMDPFPDRPASVPLPPPNLRWWRWRRRNFTPDD